MKKEYKYVLIGFVLLIVFLAIFFYIRYHSLKSEIAKPTVAPATGSTPAPPTAPYKGSDPMKWKKGDAIFILSGMVNIYQTPVASTTNILKTILFTDYFTNPFCNFESYSSGWIAVKYVSINYVGFPTVVTGYIYYPSNQNISN